MKRKGLSLLILVGILGWAEFSAGQPVPRIKRVKDVQLRPEKDLDLVRIFPFAHISLQALLNANTDGKTGFYLKRVGGAVLLSDDESFVFYPASTIKVLEHLHAMRRVQGGSVSLTTQIDIWGDSCADDHSDEIPTAKENLSESLRLMMKNSDNVRTNAIQDRFGRSAINNTAHAVVGMSQSSWLNHKFGCQGPSSPSPNKLTLADVGRIYEGVAKGTLLNGSSRTKFYELMKNETDSFFVGSVINSEAANLGLSNAKRDQFKSKVKTATKSGSISTNYDGFHYQSTAGYVSLPFAGNCSTSGFAMIFPREFVYGVFVNKATTIADGTVGTAAKELFKGQIRSALQTWKDCPNVVNLILVPRPSPRPIR